MGALDLPDPVVRHPVGGSPVDAAALAEALRDRVDGEVRFDGGSRAAYSTDASNFRQTPIGVVVPRTPEAAVEAVAVAREHGAPVLSRGGGTSLAGQCRSSCPYADPRARQRRPRGRAPGGAAGLRAARCCGRRGCGQRVRRRPGCTARAPGPAGQGSGAGRCGAGRRGRRRRAGPRAASLSRHVPSGVFYTVVESGNTGATTNVDPETHHA